jgi:hypothetical protein
MVFRSHYTGIAIVVLLEGCFSLYPPGPIVYEHFNCKSIYADVLTDSPAPVKRCDQAASTVSKGLTAEA